MENKKCDIVVLSCDLYCDVWEPFFILKNRYWKNCAYDTYLITESKKTNWCKTINVNESIWSKRVREGLTLLNSEYVIILLEDFFIRKDVDSNRICDLIEIFPENAALFNFEKAYETCDADCNVVGFKKKTAGSSYKCSCQAGLWNRKKLIELLQDDCDPWYWERHSPSVDYDFYINNSSLIIDYGHYRYGDVFGVFRGKWVKKDVVPLFRRENIKVDYKKRGFTDSIPKKAIRHIRAWFKGKV